MTLNDYMEFIHKITDYCLRSEYTKEAKTAVESACADILNTAVDFKKEIDNKTLNKTHLYETAETLNRREYTLLAENILSLIYSEMTPVSNDLNDPFGLSLSEEYNKAYDCTVEYAADTVRMMFNRNGKGEYITAKELYAMFDSNEREKIENG